MDSSLLVDALKSCYSMFLRVENPHIMVANSVFKGVYMVMAIWYNNKINDTSRANRRLSRCASLP